MNSIITVENLGKRYILNHQRQEKYVALRDVVAESMRNFREKVLQSNQKFFNESKEVFWALKDVSFDVKHGDRVGIIGRNGAGKSTLLKILSRITEPTNGKITLRGRVASLLEVGTGFHPELTGRENIYLNGSILGMTKVEIKKKFDEIVDFAEVEKFLDTPVKRYSSGMYVRLAFAVAAHLEPEILVVDEVLAVGDLQFQKKCMGKMEDVGKEGRTVLFVSHNMGLIRQLCNRAILLESGKVVKDDDVSVVVSALEKQAMSINSSTWINSNSRDKGKIAYIEKIEVMAANCENRSIFTNNEKIFVKIDVFINQCHPQLKLGFDLIKNGNVVFRTQQVDSLDETIEFKQGENSLVCEIPSRFLNAGEYFISPLLSIHCVEGLIDNSEAVLGFKINIDTNLSEYHSLLNDGNHPGALFPMLRWKKTC